MPSIPINITASATPFLTLPLLPLSNASVNSPGDSRVIRVKAAEFINRVATAQSVQLQSSVTTTKVSGTITLTNTVGGSQILQENTEGWFDTVPGENLNLILGAATQLDGQLEYEIRG